MGTDEVCMLSASYNASTFGCLGESGPVRYFNWTSESGIRSGYSAPVGPDASLEAMAKYPNAIQVRRALVLDCYVMADILPGMIFLRHSSFLSTTAEPTPNLSTTGPSSGNSTTHSSGNSSTSSFLSTTVEPSNPMSAATSKHARLMLVFATFVMPLGYL